MRSLPLPSLAFFAALKFTFRPAMPRSARCRHCRSKREPLCRALRYCPQQLTCTAGASSTPKHGGRHLSSAAARSVRLPEDFVEMRRQRLRQAAPADQGAEPYRGCVSHRARRAASPRSSAVGGGRCCGRTDRNRAGSAMPVEAIGQLLFSPLSQMLQVAPMHAAGRSSLGRGAAGP